MARNSIHVDVPPESVFEVLADPRLYANWVVGASTTRRVDGQWPEPGATLHHTQMMVLHDTTTVLEADPPRRIVLEARARPLVVVKVTATLAPEDGGTRLVLEEFATGGLGAAVPDVITETLIGVRNRLAVERLKRLAEIGRSLGRS